MNQDINNLSICDLDTAGAVELARKRINYFIQFLVYFLSVFSECRPNLFNRFRV